MPIDPSIPLNARSAPVESPVDQYAKVLGMQQAINGSRLSSLQIRSMETELGKQARIDARLKALGPQAGVNDIAGVYMGEGDAKTGAGLLQNDAAIKASQASTAKNNEATIGERAKNAGLAMDEFGQAMIGVKDDAGHMAAIARLSQSPNPYTRQLVTDYSRQHQKFDAAALGEVIQGTAAARAELKARADAAGKTEPYSPEVQAQRERERAAGRANTNVNVTVPKDALNAFNKPLAAEFDAGMKKAQAGVDTVNSIASMRDAMAGGMYAGSGASAKAAVVDLITNGFGLPLDKTKLTNTRDFTSAAGQQLLAHAKALGANPSNADAARIEKIVGSIDTDPQALQNIMEWTEQQARRSIQLHNARVKQVEDSAAESHLPSPFMYDPRVQEPPPWQPKTGKPGQPAQPTQPAMQTPDGTQVDAVAPPRAQPTVSNW